MSTERRKISADEVADKRHSASPRKKLRLSSVIEVDSKGQRVKPDAIGVGEARPSNRNKRPSVGHLRPGEIRVASSPNSSPYSGPPDQFDVSPQLLDAVTQSDGDKSYWKTEHAAFINSAAGLDNANWIGKRPLGSGGFGTAGLWELRDDNNVQIVIKESKTIPVGVWTGEVPEEVLMMRRMNKTDCYAVPNLIDYKRYMHVRKHRIYMEFCTYGDLATLSLNYKRFRAYLPEPFLWHTFNNLVKAAAAMRNGPEDVRWGYQIVHRDLKPANIFLSLEDEDSGFPSLPVAKTGDWGLATKIKPRDRRNPLGLRGAGTESYYAPEQRMPHSGDILKEQIARHLKEITLLPELSAHTNIWGIGAIMFELVTHEAVAYYLADDEWTVNEAFIAIPNLRNPKYSDALTELVKLCLMPEPWDRPSIEELELKIDASCQSIRDRYDANPSLRERDRLYYRGSEINQMPPGNWNYWNPVMKDVPRPSASPDSNEPKNPFTDTISYPPFPTSELGDPEEKGGEVRDDDDNDGKNQKPKGPRDDSVRKRIVILDDPSSGPKGNDAKHPIVISNGDEEGSDERREKNAFNENDKADNEEEGDWAKDNDESNGSSGSEEENSSGGSDDSDNSDTRRRMAVKTVPGK